MQNGNGNMWGRIDPQSTISTRIIYVVAICCGDGGLPSHTLAHSHALAHSVRELAPHKTSLTNSGPREGKGRTDEDATGTHEDAGRKEGSRTHEDKTREDFLSLSVHSLTLSEGARHRRALENGLGARGPVERVEAEGGGVPCGRNVCVCE